MKIQHNVMAMNAYRNYRKNVGALKTDIERLSSGYRINRAGDDAAGLAISEKMRAQITGLETAQKNAKDGITLVQTAEGALTEVHDMLNRIVELATQSANGTYDDAVDRFQLQKEIDQLRGEIDRIAVSTNFNGIKLLDGSLGKISSIITNTVTSTIDQTYNTGDRVDLTVGRDLPAVGKNGTVLHDEYTEFYNNAMTVDLSGITWDTTDDNKVLTIAVGDVTFKLTAKAGSDGTLENDALIEAILGRNANVDVEIKDSKDTKQPTGTENPLQLTLNGKDVKVTKSSGGKLAFTLVNDPTSMDEALKAEDIKVEINGVESAAKSAQYSFDLTTLIGDSVTKGSILKIGNYSYTFQDDNQTETKDQFIARIAEDLEKRTLINGFNTRVDNTGTNTKIILDATVPGLKTGLQFPTIQFTRVNDYTLKANEINEVDPGDPDISAIHELSIKIGGEGGLSSDVHLKIFGKIYYFDDSINHNGHVDGGIYILDGENSDLIKNGGRDVNDWNIKAERLDDGSFKITFTALQGGDYWGEKGSSDEAIEDIKNSLKVIDPFLNTEVDNQPEFNLQKTDTEGHTGSPAEYKFRLDDWVPGTKIIINNSTDREYDIGDGTQDKNISYVIINNIAYILKYSSDTNDITLTATQNKYGTPPEVSYTRYEPDPPGKITGYDGQNTEEIKKNPKVSGEKSKESGKEQKASTKFQLTEDFVAEGARLRIGEVWYEFIADSSKQGTVKKDKDGNDETDKDGYRTVYVDVSGGDLTKIAGNLKSAAAAVNAAADKAVWEVEADGDWIYLTETEAHANLDGNKDLADYRKNCIFNLNTVKGVNDSLDYEGVLRHKLVEVTEETEELVEGQGLILQIGDTNDEFNKLHIYINDCRTKAMVYTDENGNDYSLADISVADQQSAADAIEVVKNAVNYISDVRGQLGAYQNRLEHTINNLSVMTENIQDAESTIRDTDIAAIMMEYTKNNILIQSAQAMLAQANQVPQGVLQLLL